MQTKPSPLFPLPLVGVLALLFVLSLAAFLYQNYQVGDSEIWQLLTSGVLLSIPLALFYGLVGVLAVAAQQHAVGPVDQRLVRIIYWSPRIAGILIILFVSMFALDAFSPDNTLLENLFAFLMHMLPSIFMAALLVAAWRWEWVGFGAFLLASLFFMRFVLRDPAQMLGMFLLFSGPMLLIALLFGANWRWRAELR